MKKEDKRFSQAAKALHKQEFPEEKWGDLSPLAKKEYMDVVCLVATSLEINDEINPYHMAVTEVLIDVDWLSSKNRFDDDVVAIVNKIVKAVLK